MLGQTWSLGLVKNDEIDMEPVEGVKNDAEINEFVNAPLQEVFKISAT